MAVWNVQTNMVQLGGVNIVGYVGHFFAAKYSNETASVATPFTEYSLIVRLIDVPSNTARTNALAAATAAEQAIYAAENASRQTVREIRPAVGDTITWGGGTITVTGNSTTGLVADVGGVQQL